MLNNPNIDRPSRIQLAIIENHLLELHHAAVDNERSNILSIIRQLIQEKDAAGDQTAVAVLDWALERILRGV